MTVKLFCSAIIKFILGIILVGLFLFLPAGTIRYLNGWLFMGILFIPMFVAGIVMMIKNPELLCKRLNAKEKQNEQSLVIKLSGLMFITGFILAGLDFRFGWLPLSQMVSYIAAIVRHPMYSVTIILFLAMPLVLGSIFSFVVFLFYPLLIAKRIKNEEQVLEAELDGYADYKKKVRYRLIPFIW